MRPYSIALIAVLLISIAQAQTAAPAAPLPVRKVVLYKTGVGYFEHAGKVRGNQDLSVDFTTAQLNDVLKSLTIVDAGGGHIEGVRYNSVASIAERLRNLRLSLGEQATTAELLSALRGTKVEVQERGATNTGTVLSVERKTAVSGNGVSTAIDELSIITPTGQLKRFQLTPAVSVRVADPELGRELTRYLSVVGSARSRDFRQMTISARGTGERELSLSYISEVPVWKSTYRLVLPDDQDKPALLQGWAIVDNTIGEDWNNVRLSLVAGAPQSFVEDLSQPFYVRRPVVENPSEVSSMPQVHAVTMEAAATVPVMGGIAIRTSLHGVVTDPQGAVVAGARVVLTNAATGETQQTMTNSSGAYSFESAPVGNVTLEVNATNFQPARLGNIFLASGQYNQVSVPLAISGGTQTVEVVGEASRVETEASMLSTFGGKADAARRGEMFEYAIPQPVTVAKNQSALVPILQGKIKLEKVTLWNASEPQALHAVWVTNDTGLTLDGGAFEILDHDAFAGEGIMTTLHPDERRLLSYAADTAVSVVALGEKESDKENADDDDPPVAQTSTRIRIQHGEIRITREQRATMTYHIHNADTTPRTVVIEHPLRAEWKLVPSLKPEEVSTDAYRFERKVAAGATEKLEVVTTHPDEDSYTISNLNDQTVAVLVTEKHVPDAVVEALHDFAARKRVISQLEAEMQAKNKEMETINTDQARVRENMKALRGSAEERSLLQRYTRQLNEQEDRIAALRTELAQLTARRDQLQGELNAAIEKLDVDQQL